MLEEPQASLGSSPKTLVSPSVLTTGRSAWVNCKATVVRVERVYAAWLEGEGVGSIANREGISRVTAYHDIERGRQLALLDSAVSVVEKRQEAVSTRRHIQHLALKDRESAEPDDASGRSQLLRVVTGNQDAVEELQGLKAAEQAPQQSVQTSVVVVSAQGISKSMEDLDESELDALIQRLESAGSGHEQLWSEQ